MQAEGFDGKRKPSPIDTRDINIALLSIWAGIDCQIHRFTGYLPVQTGTRQPQAMTSVKRCRPPFGKGLNNRV